MAIIIMFHVRNQTKYYQENENIGIFKGSTWFLEDKTLLNYYEYEFIIVWDYNEIIQLLL